MQKINFVLLGVAGYIAPKHLEAIKAIGGNLVAACDPNDSVGILDRYFPNCKYFKEFERFERFCHLFTLKEPIHFVSICTPNYLHDSHCRFALRIGANAICEKPLVINPHNILMLQYEEERYKKKIYPILQLRSLPIIQKVKQFFEKDKGYKKVKINYYTPRGNWYDYSWKGDISKSGGLHTNIAIHFFDLLFWLTSKSDYEIIYFDKVFSKSGFLRGLNGRIDIGGNVKCLFNFSTDIEVDLKREFIIQGFEESIIFDGFENAHVQVYKRILEDDWFDISTCRPSIKLCDDLKYLIYNKGEKKT